MSEKQRKRLADEGNFTGKITCMDTIKHRFKGENGEIEIKVEAQIEDGREVDLYLDLSGEYNQHTGKLRAQEAMETLQTLGHQDGCDLRRLNALIGMPISFFGKKNDKGQLNYYISTRKEEPIDPALASRRFAELMGGGGQPQGNGGGMFQGQQQQGQQQGFQPTGPGGMDCGNDVTEDDTPF